MRVLLVLSVAFLIFKFCENVVLSSDGYLCSKEDVCSMDGTSIGDDSLDTCCQPCLCANNCTFGQCCPDVSEFVESDVECKHQLEFLPHFNFDDYEKHLDGVSGTSYYVVSKCPPDTPFTLRMDCEFTVHPSDNKYVHDAATYKIYKNEMCARCNGVTTYVKWRIAIPAFEAEVQTILEDTNLENKELGIDRLILSVPPLDYPDNTNVCYRNAIKSCNETGKWDIYNENLEQLCNLSQFAHVVFMRAQYRNIYCALCNRVTSDPFTGILCKYRTIHAGKNAPWKNDAVHLLILMSYDESTTSTPEVDEKRSNKCPIIEQFKSACLNVTCPLGQYYIGGECVQGRLEMHVMKVEVEIILELDSEPTVHNVFEFIKMHVLSQLKFEDNNCAVDFYGLKRFTYVRPEYRLYVLVKTTDICRIETLLKIVRTFEKQFSTPNMIQISTSEVVFVKASISASETRASFQVDDWLHTTGSILAKKQTFIKLKPKYYCATIKYSPNDIRIALGERVANAMMLASEVYMVDADQANPAYNDTRIICVSAYRRVLIENGLFNSGTLSKSLFSILFMVPCFIAYYYMPK